MNTQNLFPLGQVVTTHNSMHTIKSSAMIGALERHAKGDWGDLCESDAESNNRALHRGSGRLFSAYGSGCERFWIITEADRSVTTILLPLDY